MCRLRAFPDEEDRALSGYRRPGWTMLLGPVTMALTVLVLIVVSIGPTTLVGDRTFGTFDVLRSIQPWKSYTDERPKNPLITDPVNGSLPRFDAARERLARGDIPLWTTYVSTGAPLLGLPHNGLLSPQDTPQVVLPLTAGPAWSKLLEGVAAVGLMYLFLRRLGVTRMGGLLGGAVFFFTGFQIVWQGWSHTHVAALIPGLFWSVEFAMQRGNREPLPARAAALVPLAGIVGWMWLEGFPPITLWALQTAGGYALIRVWLTHPDRRSRIGWLGALVVAVVVGTAVAAVQLLPFAEWLSARDLAGRSRWADFHLPLEFLATLVVPNAFGSPIDRLYYGALDYVETQSYVGIGALVLAVSGAVLPNPSVDRRRGARTALVLLFAFVAVVVFVGGPLLEGLSALRIPPYGTNSVGRQRAIMGAILAVLAGVGWDTIRTSLATARRRHMITLGAVGSLIIGAVTYGLVEAHGAAEDIDRASYFWRQLRWPLGALIATAVGVVLVRARSRVARPIGAALLSAAVLLPGAWLAYGYWARPADEAVYPMTPAHRFLRDNLEQDRFVSAGRAMEPGTNVAYGIRSLTAHTFQSREFVDLVRAVDPDAYGRHPTFPLISHRVLNEPSSVLDRLAARYLVTSVDDPVFGEREPPPDADGHKKIHAGKAVHAAPPPADARAVSVRLLRKKFGESGSPPWLRTRVYTNSGTLLGGGQVRMHAGVRGGILDVPITWQRDGVPGYTEIRVVGDDGWVLLGAVDETPVTGTVRATRDGLELVFAEGVAIYRRSTALPRFRWASHAEVIPDPQARVSRLSEDLPDDTAVLHGGTSLAQGLPATIDVLRGGEDEMHVRVEAEGDGYLVVADTLSDEWAATVDGRPAELLPVDHAMVGVVVREGQHEVRLRYRPRSLFYGAWISATAVSILLAAVLWHLVSRASSRYGRSGRRADRWRRPGTPRS